MNKEEQESRQKFFDEICQYEYITPNGFLILEPFGVYLSHCFGFDGILEMSPQPIDVYHLLLQILEENFSKEDLQKFVRFVEIKDWTPEMEYFYPEKIMTCVYISALVHISHDWIYEIGHTLMGVPRPVETPKYFYWAKEEWTAVFQFINGYHNYFSAYKRKFDLDSIKERGYSLFEALHLARTKDIDYDEAIKILKSRHDAYQAALTQIRRAINLEFYLEAITLTENIISNCIYNYLHSIKIAPPNSTFHVLILEVLKSNTLESKGLINLFKSLDKWRKMRNTSVHGFVETQSDGLTGSYKDFFQLSKATANEGERLCEKVVRWYESECVNFVKYEFPSIQGFKH